MIWMPIVLLRIVCWLSHWKLKDEIRNFLPLCAPLLAQKIKRSLDSEKLYVSHILTIFLSIYFFCFGANVLKLIFESINNVLAERNQQIDISIDA